MAAATQPIYSRTGDIQWGNLTTANTAKDGTGTVVTVFTADATEGGFVTKLIIMPQGTNVASVLRVFLNNGASNATPGNNILVYNTTLAATTNSEVAQLTAIEILIGIALPPGYKLNCTIGTSISAGVAVTAIGGKY